jgi:hypothetical protein
MAKSRLRRRPDATISCPSSARPEHGGTVALGDPWAASSAGLPARSDCQSELVEDRAEPVAGGDVGGDVVVAAAQVLHEGVTGGEDPR